MKKMILLFFILLGFPFLTNAQLDVQKMLKDIKGTIDEIIIKSDGKEYTFSGDEAAKLFSEMKKDNKMKRFKFFTDDGKVITGDSLNKKIVINDLGKDLDDDKNNILVFIDDDGEMHEGDVNKVEKKIIVSENDGKKVVKVTENEDGKENVEVYEGKAAEEYLEKMKSEKEFDVKVDVDKDSKHKKIKKIIIEKTE